MTAEGALACSTPFRHETAGIANEHFLGVTL
jgi:hypothetical protein